MGSEHYLGCITVKLRLRKQPKDKKSIRVKYRDTERCRRDREREGEREAREQRGERRENMIKPS